MKRLPPKMIQGVSVRDYAYQWISGGCPLHQWCSGARGIDVGVITYVAGLYVQSRLSMPEDKDDSEGLFALLKYLHENLGHPREQYIADEHSELVVS